MRNWIGWGLGLAFCGMLPAPGMALEFEHQDTVLQTDIEATTDGRLGTAVAINRGAVFMGAPNIYGQDGATWQYRINNQRKLEFVKKLVPQAVTPRRYGESIVSQGDVTAVSYGSDDVIELYVLQNGTWVLTKTLEPPSINDITIRGFGEYMDVEGGLLAVGDPTANVSGAANAGVVMLFDRNQGGANNWGMVAHFTHPTPLDEVNYASAVGIADNILVVGDEGAETAFVYLKSGNNWSFGKELQPQGIEIDDSFGVSVEADGNFVAVGATNGNDAPTPTNSGSVHIFNRNDGGADNFGQVAQLAPSSPEFIDRYGESMRLRGELLAVGAPGSNQAYVYSHLSGVWAEEQKILPPQNLTYKNADFGKDVDYQGGSLMVGADRWNDISSARDGAVFLYEARGVVLCGELDGIYCDSLESQ